MEVRPNQPNRSDSTATIIVRPLERSQQGKPRFRFYAFEF
jgi:hypothetical protein